MNNLSKNKNIPLLFKKVLFKKENILLYLTFQKLAFENRKSMFKVHVHVTHDSACMLPISFIAALEFNRELYFLSVSLYK